MLGHGDSYICATNGHELTIVPCVTYKLYNVHVVETVLRVFILR